MLTKRNPLPKDETLIISVSFLRLSKIFPNLNGALGTLNGSVVLHGRPAAPNAQWQIPLTVDFYESGNMTTPGFSYNVTTDDNGNFSCNDIPLGTYKIAIKNSHTLKKVTSLQTIGTGVNTLNFGTLKEGDALSENAVDVFDFSVLLNSFYKSIGEPGYDSRADFNGDNTVDVFDFSLLLNSFYQYGDEP